MAERSAIPACLSIAGSDSGGGAGIQADLKAFARCGVHGMTAITALTAQNTVGVTGVHVPPVEFLLAQVEAVLDDLAVAAVKTGMLATEEVVRAVAGLAAAAAFALPLLYALPDGRPFWTRHRDWLLVTQALLTYVPLAVFGSDWIPGLAGLLGGLLLLTVAVPASWLLFATAVAAEAAKYRFRNR